MVRRTPQALHSQALRTGAGAARLASVLACLGLVNCSQGASEREKPSPRTFIADVEFPQPEIEQEPVESENNRLARENTPSQEAVRGIPDGLVCDGDPGSSVLHRLNATEYNRTVQDLLGDETRPADVFPKDDYGDSFNNNAQALSINPILAEAYVDAAETLALNAMAEGNPSAAELVPCSPQQDGAENCARTALAQFLGRAFRRPVSDEELIPYVGLVMEARDLGATFEEGIQTAVEAALLSVNFLFRVELDAEPASEDFHRLTDFELASRLSYFLWSTMPDAELFAAAERHTLTQFESSTELTDIVRRMLADERSDALLDSFLGQWLETADISLSNQPAPDVFPEFTPDLQAAMEMETRLFLKDILRGELPFSELLTADYTYANKLLADYYGLDSSGLGDEFERVELGEANRQGLLTQGSILTLTAAPNRTSPVRRGVFVLSNLLCSAPPPPPPDVQGNLEVAEEESELALPLSERQKLHSSDPSCATCHQLMDPIGLGLENFDAIGRFRTEENGQELQTSGTLRVNGEEQTFEGALELSALLSQDPRLGRCAAEKLLTYALGRLVRDDADHDRCRIEALLQDFADQDFDMPHLIERLVLTDSFRGRRGGLELTTSTEEEE